MMARNWQGMFNQMNQAIRANPLNGDIGTGLLGDLSMSAGQGIASALNQRGPQLKEAVAGDGGAALSQAPQADPYDFMSPLAKQKMGAQQLAQADLSTPEGLKQAAGTYQKMGDTAKAMALLEKAKQKEDAAKAKEVATLEAAGQGMTEEAARKKKHAQKVQATALARRNKDLDVVAGLQSGAISPEAYLMKLTDKKNDNTTLADGAMLVGPNGEVLAENVKDSKGTPLTATMQKRVNDNNDAYFESTALSNEYDDMLSRIDTLDLSAGLMQTVETAFNNATGRRDEDDYFRTQAIKLKNHEAIQSLPKGPASDRDIAIVMRGFPADNAGPEEIKQFLEASSRVAKKVAQFSREKANYIDRNGDEAGFINEWERKMEIEAKQERVNETPQPALEYLYSNANSQAVRDMFMTKYNWLPDNLPEIPK